MGGALVFACVAIVAVTLRCAPGTERSVTTDPKLPVENLPPADPTPASTDNSAWLLHPPPSASHPQSGLQLWLHRTSVFLFVLISAVAGVLLLILPWTPEWTDNYLLLTYPCFVL